MAFKGTERLPARQIAEEIENGGEVNAATSTETTSYCARVLKDHVPLAVDISRTSLDGTGGRGRTSSREARHPAGNRRANDTVDDVVFDKLLRGCLPRPGSSAAPFSARRTRCCPSRPAKSAYYLDRNYTTDRMFVVAAGAVNHDEFVRQVEDRFSSLHRAESVTGVRAGPLYRRRHSRDAT